MKNFQYKMFLFTKYLCLLSLILFSFKSQIAKADAQLETQEIDQAESLYTVEILGLEEYAALRELLEKNSSLVELEGRPPPSLEALRTRVFDDLPGLRILLENAGYFDAIITPYFERQAGEKYKVILDIGLGDLYYISHFKVIQSHTLNAELEAFLEDSELLGIKLNSPAQTHDILSAEKKILERLAQEGHPFARIAERKIKANAKDKSLSVDIFLDVGEMAFFGPVVVEGTEEVDPSYVLNEVSWAQGDQFNADRMERLRRRLMKTGLFTAVQITTAQKTDINHHLPIYIRVTEGKKHYIGFGARFASKEDLGFKAFWGHRNLFGHGELYDITVQKAKLKSFIQNSLTLPHFLRPHQSLNLALSGIHENPEAYKKKGVGGVATLARTYGEYWDSSLGFGYERSQLEKKGVKKTFSFPSIPFSVGYNSLQDVIDPTDGMKAQWKATVFPKILGGQADFTQVSLNHSFHKSLDKLSDIVVSGFMNFGFIPGAKQQSIPLDKLFYAGGAGSVRGYGYQMAGPLDSDQKPFGGRSLFETGLELLTKIHPEYALVGFVEGGGVFGESYPSFSQKLFWGVGVGFRYYTTVGPIRVDVAIPMERRRKVDDAFQIYVGVGQSF